MSGTELPGWHREINELHEFFEGLFLGSIESLTRAEVALAKDFTMAGPDGSVSGRAAIMAMLDAGRAHTASLRIEIEDHQLLAETDDMVIANYVEVHRLSAHDNRRRTTVVFRKAADAPNGVRWLRAHETWIDRGLGD